MKKHKILLAVVLAAILVPSATYANQKQINNVINTKNNGITKQINQKIEADNSGKFMNSLGGSKIYWRSIKDNDSAFIVQAFDKQTDWKNTDNYTDKQAAEIRKEQAVNTVATIKTIPAKEIDKLLITSSFCGIAIEPIDGENIVVSYAGVKDTNRLQVDVGSQNDTLFVNAFGKTNEMIFVDADKEERINTILIQVPKNALELIEVNDTTSAVIIEDMGVPVQGETINGMIKIKGSTIKSNHTLSCVNGDIFLLGNAIDGNHSMDSVNGSVRVVAQTINGNANLECVNGSVVVEAEEILGDIKTECVNGSVAAILAKQPTNLTFLAQTAHNGTPKLPSGWENNKVIGNGTPKLTMKAVNGTVSLSIK